MHVIDTSNMQKIGGQMGSNPAAIYQDAQGRCFYVKTLESPLYARNEMLAAKLYQLAGAPTLNYLATTQAEQVATELVSLQKKCVAQLNQAERKQAQRWLGVHAWTANWDVAGFLGENQGLVDGRVITLDVGGALEFRAMGDPKGKAFGIQAGELDSLRQDSNNPFAVRLFGDMNAAEIEAAIQIVVQIPDAAIRQVIMNYTGRSSLADKMIARKANMLSRITTG